MLFTELALDPRLQQAIADRGYTELTPVQEKTLDKSLKGRGFRNILLSDFESI